MLVMPVITYDSFERVMDSLTHVGVSANNETKDGNFIILDSLKAY